MVGDGVSIEIARDPFNSVQAKIQLLSIVC